MDSAADNGWLAIGAFSRASLLSITPSGSPVRELYVVSCDETDDPAQFRTEIRWPVQR